MRRTPCVGGLILVCWMAGAVELRAGCDGAGAALSGIGALCDALDVAGLSAFAKCTPTKNTCTVESNTVFTGAAIEFATPQNIKLWNGRGGAGRDYALTGVCALRDLGKTSVGATASLDTLIGKVSFVQKLGLLEFHPGRSPSLRGYQRASLCGPVIGCIDGAVTQEFGARMDQKDDVPPKSFAGEYEIRQLHGVAIASDQLDQGLELTGPKFPVPAPPLGTLFAQPVISFQRSIKAVGSPFEGSNTTSSMAVSGAELGQMTEARGLDAGRQATAAKQRPLLTGWIGQLGLGGRAAKHSNSAWAPPAGQPWPVRPDTSLARARSGDEARPNLNAEARLDIVYDLLENWPPAKAVKESGLMASESKLSITMRPALEVSGSMQWDLRNSETAQWSFTGELPPALPKLGDLDQFRSLEIYGGSSVGAAFHVDVLLDLVLSIDTPFAPISLLDFHDDLRVLNIEATGPAPTREWPRQARFKSQASQILKGKPFTQYDTLAGAISTADNQGVQAHLRACTTEPLAGSVLPPAKWTPGDPKELAIELRTACNVCAAWSAGTTTDSAGKHVSYPGFGPGLILPASQAGKSPSLRWLCDAPTKNGCHDICKIESGALTVVQTAVELQAMGGKTNCNAAAPVVIH